jgi:hypothetical protein
MRARLLLSAFLVSAAVAASQSACTAFYECIYVTYKGYQVCADLEPVSSIDRAGVPIEIATSLGFPPRGCSCMHPDSVELWDANQLDPVFDPVFEQIRADAQVACEELAIGLGADPTPCDAAVVDKSTGFHSEGPTAQCPFSDGDIDDDPDCPPIGEDEVSFETGDDDTETDTTDGGVVIIPDLPKQP